MIRCQTRQWGNSVGIIIPHDVVESYSLKPNEEVIIEIKKRVNVLKELFGTLPFKKPTHQILKEARAELETKL